MPDPPAPNRTNIINNNLRARLSLCSLFDMCSPGDTPSSLARRNDSDSHHPPPISPSPPPSHSHSHPTYIPPFWCCFVLISISISFSLVFVEYTSCPVTITDLIQARVRGPAFLQLGPYHLRSSPSAAPTSSSSLIVNSLLFHYSPPTSSI